MLIPCTTVALVGGVVYVPILGVVLFASISGYFIVAVFRQYFHQVEQLKEKMRNFSFDNSKCYCCDVGHGEDGDQIMCDRQILKGCVCTWFGREEVFEDFIRSKVMEKVSADLENRVLSRTWSLAICVPMLWTFCDLFASWAAVGDYGEAFPLLLEGFVLWFLASPIITGWVTLVSWKYCHEAESRACEIMKNFGVLLLGMLGIIFVTFSYFLPHFLFDIPVYRASFFTGIWCLVVFHLWVTVPFRPSCYKRAPW